MNNSLIALTLVFVPQVVRIAESVTTQVRKLDYIDAARMSGAGAPSIIRVHVLGNVLGPVFVYTTGLISVSMILGSGLSFLGLGQHQAEATSLLAIVPVAIVGTYRQDRYGNVRRSDALLLGLLSLAGAAAGVALANALSGAFLRDAFAALMVLVAAQLVRRTLRG